MPLLPFGFTALIAFYYYRRSGLARGYVYAVFLSLLTDAILLVPSASPEMEQGLRTVATQASSLLSLLFFGSLLALRVSFGNGLHLVWSV